MLGHNSVEGKQLTGLVERIEKLEEEKSAIADDIKDMYAEAKANGYDTKVLRYIVKLRKQDADQRRDFLLLTDVYMHALGMTPGEALEASGVLD